MVYSNVKSCSDKNAWQDKYKTYYDSTHAVVKWADSMKNVADRYKKEAQQLATVADMQTATINMMVASGKVLHSRNDSLNRQVDSLIQIALAKDTLPEVPKLMAALAACDTTRISLTREIAVKDTIIDSLNSRDNTRLADINNLTVAFSTERKRADSLQHHLEELPLPERNKFLGLININNNQSFLIGLAVGVGGYFIVRNYVWKHL